MNDCIEKKKTSVFAPASIGNLSVGFDILGLCVKTNDRLLGDTVSIELSKQHEFVTQGTFSYVLPTEQADNLVLQAYQLFMQAVPASQADTLRITLSKDLPICSGLGSSAASVVATIHALNVFYGNPLSNAQALVLMGEVEAIASGSVHYDNIAPSYLGGLTLSSLNSPDTYRLPWPSDWTLLLAYADIDIPTEQARSVLPRDYPRATTIEHAQNTAHFIHALHVNDSELAAKSLMDVIAEPYRASLLPNFSVVKKTMQEQFSVKAVGISGSGPTIFAIVDKKVDLEAAKQYLQSEYIDKAFLTHDNPLNKAGFVIEAEINQQGTILV